MEKGLLLILTLLSINFAFGQERDSSFVGKWISKPNANGMINLISLNKDGSGISGPGFFRNGKIELSQFMKSDLQDWKVKNDTLILTTKPIPRGQNREPKSMTLVYIISEKKEDTFSAYYSDPEMDKMMEEAGEKVEPIKLEFKKTE
jgi:hypothetical protein